MTYREYGEYIVLQRYNLELHCDTQEITLEALTLENTDFGKLSLGHKADVRSLHWLTCRQSYIGDIIKQTLGVYTGLHVDNTNWSHWRSCIVNDLTVGPDRLEVLHRDNSA